MDTLELGSRLNDYLIVNVLGKGGFGVTYQALDPSLQRHLAIKEYFPEQFAERREGTIVAREGDENQKMFQWGLERFLSEARTLARFQHPNVVEVTRYFEANGSAYLAMKFEEGKNLDDWLKDRKEPLSESEIKSLILPILDGLQAIHEQGLIHRDVKPQNIMIRNDGTPVLIDFGSARPSSRKDNSALTAVISPGYSPPEQYGIDDSSLQGPSTDIYAISGVVYRMITGTGPPDALLRIAGRKLVPAADAAARKLNPQLLAAVDAGLALDPAARPQSALEFRSLLEGKPTRKPAKTQPASDDNATFVRPIPGNSPAESRSSGWLWGVLAALAVAVSGYFGIGWWQETRTPVETAAAEIPASVGAQAFTIDVTPAAAAVEFRDRPERYSAGMLLPPGDYSIVVSADGYQNWEETLPHGSTPSRHEVSLAPQQYPFTLDLSPQDAKVEFTGAKNADNEDMSLADEYGAGMMLAAGRYQLEVSAPGYVTSREWLDHRQETATHSIKLASEAVPVPTTAAPRYTLTLDLSPSDATVEVVGLGRRYEPGLQLEAGKYRIKVTGKGYATWEQDYLMPARRATLAVTLQPKAGAEFQDVLAKVSSTGQALDRPGPKMVVIPAGTFEMGDLASIGEADENPVHRVSISKAFALSKFEITFDDFDQFARATNIESPSNKSGDGNRPVVKVSWDKAREYANWLSARAGEQYRLPTEAEWEYAARAGTTTRYPWGKEIACNMAHVAICKNEWGRETAPVGSFGPNAFGLFDMHGNVLEMTQDCYHNSYNGVPKDGSAWERSNGSYCDVRVTRGGSVSSTATQLRSARRSHVDPKRNPYTDLGFRVARTIK